MIFFPVAIRMGFGNEELMTAVVMRCSPTTSIQTGEINVILTTNDSLHRLPFCLPKCHVELKVFRRLHMKNFKNLILITQIAFQMISPILIGVFIGIYLDCWLNTSPVLVIIFMVLRRRQIGRASCRERV